MSIRKRPSTKTKSGYTYQVYFPYVAADGSHKIYYKGGFVSKKDASAHEREIKDEIENYGCTQEENDLTIDKVYKDAMELKKKKIAVNTLRGYEISYNNHIKSKIGNRKIKSIRYKDIQTLLDDAETYDISKNMKKVLSIIYKYAKRQGIIKENIVQLTTLPNEKLEAKEAYLRAATEEQIDRIIEEIQKPSKYSPNPFEVDWINKNYAIAIQISKYTGLRVAEVYALDKSDIDFEKNTIDINKKLQYQDLKKEDFYVESILKTNSSKAILPLAYPLKVILEQWFEENPFEHVIADPNGKYMDPKAMNNKISYICKKLGFKYVFHMGRHFFGTYLSEKKTPIEITQKLLRHSNISTTMKYYVHVSDERKEDAINKAFGKGRKRGKNKN